MLDDTEGGSLMSGGLWHNLKGLYKKAKKTFTDPGESIKEIGGSTILAGLGVPSFSGVGSSLVDMAKDGTLDHEFYRVLQGYIPGTNINPIDRYLGRDIAQMNFEQQQEAYEYQKWLNEQQMSREDSAYQRKLKDMTAAGFNPILASGGSGEATSPLRAGSAPQMADTSGALRDLVGQALSFVSFRKDLAQKDGQIALMSSQKKYYDALAMGKSIENDYLGDYYSGRNTGITLRNESYSIANSYAGRLNEAKLDQVKGNLDKMSSEIEKNNALKDLLKEQKILAVKDQVLRGLQQSDLSSRISERYLDMMATAYSLQWYQKHGLAYGQSNDNQLLLSAIDKVLDFFKSGNGSVRYGIDPDRPGAPSTSINLDNVRNPDGSLKGYRDSVIYQFFSWLFGGQVPGDYSE